MSSANKGLRVRVKEVSKAAIYTHCYSHRLNIALQDGVTNIGDPLIIHQLDNAFTGHRSFTAFLRDNPKSMHGLESFIEQGSPRGKKLPARLRPI